MKLIKTCIFPLLLVLVLLFISHHVCATATSQDGKKADEEPKQPNVWRRGRICRYGCCGHWRGNFCSYCCRPEGSGEVTNDDDDDDDYGWGGRGGFGFGWGGRGGGWGGSWGGSWGGGGWGGCRYGCCGHRHGHCDKCCDSAAEAKAHHQNEDHP